MSEKIQENNNAENQAEKLAEMNASESIEQEWERVRGEDGKEAESRGINLIRQKHNPLGGEVEREEAESEEPANEEPKREEEAPVDRAEATPAGGESPVPGERLESRREKTEGDQPQPSLGKRIAKSVAGAVLNSAGSILGVRSVWEVPKWISQGIKKKEQRRQLSKMTIEILEEAREQSKARVEVESEAEKIAEEHKNDAKLQADGDEILAKEGIARFTDEAGERMQKWYSELSRERVAKREEEKEDDGGKTKQEAGAEAGLKPEYGPVFSKIRELEDKLEKVKMLPEDKKALRDELASVLKQYRSARKEQENIKAEKLTKALAEHINARAQRMLAVKESFNTLTIATAMPMLRTAVYAGFSVVERLQKTKKQAIENVMKDKKITRSQAAELIRLDKSILKDSFKNAFLETFHGLTFSKFSKAEKGKIQKSAEFAAVISSVLRYSALGTGFYEYERAMGTGRHIELREGAQKWIEAIKSGDWGEAGAQMGRNWIANIDRLVGYAGLDRPVASTLGSKLGLEEALDKSEGNAVDEWQKQLAEQLEKDRQKIGEVFKPDSEIAAEILAGGVSEKEANLIETLKNAGLKADDLSNFKGDPDKLSDLIERTAGLGDSRQEAIKVLIENPDLADKLDDPLTQSILANGKLSGEHVKDILSAKHVAEINKPGGSVSEALGRALTRDAKVTLVNPDGSVIENFDANLVHKGDVVALSEEGDVTVFKASGISMKEGQSLEGVYKEISARLDKAEVPREVKEVFNRGEGYWGEKITRGESREILDWWQAHEDAYRQMSDDQRDEFLRKIADIKSKEELDKIFDGILKPPEAPAVEAAVVAPETAPKIPEQAFDFTKEPALAREWGGYRAADVIEGRAGGKLSLLDNDDTIELRQREELREYLGKMRERSGFHPLNEGETVEEYIKRTRDFLLRQDEMREDLRSSPEALNENWPPAHSRSGIDAISKDAWSDVVMKGAEFVPGSLDETVRIGAENAVVDRLIEIFKESKLRLSTMDDWDKMALWKEMKDRPAGNIFDGKFGRHFSLLDDRDLVDRDRYLAVRDYLKELKEKTGAGIDEKEKLWQYVRRANELLARQGALEGKYSPDTELE